MTITSVAPIHAALLVTSLLLVRTASADDIRVMTSGSFTAAYLALTPQCERATKDTFVTVTTSVGTGLAFIPTRLQRGEPADVVIVDDALLLQMIKDGLVMADSRIELARSNIGMAVRAGAPKPDISSVEALKNTLLQAKSIAYSASVSGRYLSTELFQRLGIADQVMGKSRRIEGERVGDVVARGEAEIGFQQISELLPIPRYRLRWASAAGGSANECVFSRRRSRFRECECGSRAHQMPGVSGSSRRRDEERVGARRALTIRDVRFQILDSRFRL